MNIIKASMLVGALLATGGCATMAQDSARKDAMADCAAQGLRYLEEGSTAREGLVVSTGGVRYYCIGPDDPRYAEAVDPNA